MNIEIANRLVEFRKKNGLSQEQLAEKIGVSRQAVSKWERSEASPDTDNLILLARLYNVSLDDLLRTEDEIPMPEKEKEAEPAQPEEQASGFENNVEDNAENDGQRTFNGGINVNDGGDRVHVGWDGIHVEEKGGDRVHVGWDGIHVEENCGDNVDVSCRGVYVNGERVDHLHKKSSIWTSFPYAILVIIAFLCLGFIYNAWWWAWLLFLTIPVFHGTVKAIVKRKLWKFPYELVTVIAFLCMGMFYDWWHPGWAVFLTIPVFRWICSIVKDNRKKSKAEENIEFGDGCAGSCESFSTTSDDK